ncbi:MAG: DNA mismatch repair protein MutS [Chloroflexi bacterium]|nr:DNA mismatch repair protein MutS [Chloroflexota bacterium]
MVTPIRRQYLRVKQRYPSTIVLFRLGDFYETFDEDARVVSRELGIVLTGRDMGKDQRVPMAGIPHHALDNYLGKLIAQGYKVAICEQLSEPSGHGLVERDVVRVVTPGTVLEPNLLEQKSNNYLAAVVVDGEQAGLAYIDVTTSEFAVTQMPFAHLPLELARLQPAEVLTPPGARDTGPGGVHATELDSAAFDLELAQERLLARLEVSTLEGFGCAGLPLAVRAAGAIVDYLEKTQRDVASQLSGLTTYSTQSYMVLDPQTRRNLELFQGGRSATAQHSLLAVLDFTRTAMGARLLKRWLGQPLLGRDDIERRLEAVAWLHAGELRRGQVAALLGRVSDLERLVNRVRGGIATPRDLVAMRHSLEVLTGLGQALREGGSVIPWPIEALQPKDEVAMLIARAIVEEPPLTLADGGVIRQGFSPELDSLRLASRNAKDYIANLEREERQRTGIKSLKVGYNKVFGYYIEVSKANLPQAPAHYIRKQTIVNGERFITPELKEYESLVLNAEERLVEMEASLFRQICSQVAGFVEQVLAAARCIAEVDVLASFAEAASRHRYVRPVVMEGTALRIGNGRHPMVERALPAGAFEPNDTDLSSEEAQVVVLTGPNMAGKSTYLRQVALIALMAQIGSFVPADRADIGLVDRIFTRIGLQDDLALGQSTFMVEMVETAQILHQATARSLVILDEIGRGTSTYDGLSIAQAVVEHLHNAPRLGAKTLFATHYHELTELAFYLPRVRNYNVAVAEEGGKVAFLHKIVPGGADKSYGVHVAQLAGLPRSIVRRAQEVLADLETRADHAGDSAPSPKARGVKGQPGAAQLDLFGPHPAWVEELLALDLNAMTPLEALTKLYELQSKARE